MTAMTHTLSALAAGALLLSAAGAAQAQTPYTAYNSQARDLPNSCRNVQQLANGYVSAECQADGGWRWSSLRPVDCRSSIANRDGVLSCTGARATVGALYPDNGGGYDGQSTVPTQQPGGIIGALFGAVFGDAFGNDRQVEQDYDQGVAPWPSAARRWKPASTPASATARSAAPRPTGWPRNTTHWSSWRPATPPTAG